MFGIDEEKRRKPFTLTQKRIEWMQAAGRGKDYAKNGKFYKTSRCRKCKIRLIWGDRSYDFDHKDNNSSNNSQRNCYLVCKICHGKATKIAKHKVRGILGDVIGYKTVKKKVGYKKPKAKPKPKRKKRRVSSIWDL